MGHMTQTLVDNVHDKVTAFKIGASFQRLGERLGLEEGGIQGQMAFVVFGFYLGTGSGGFEGRNGGVVDLAEQVVQG